MPLDLETPERLQYLYAEMYRIRRVEERIAEHYPEQEMRCPVHLCIGQEAIAVGVCAELKRADYVFSTHRSHGHFLAKGGDLGALLGEMYGRDMGCSRGKGGSMHMIDLPSGVVGAAPILGATISIAVGAAMGIAMRGEDRIAAAFFGDASTEEGTFYEAVSYAALQKLPVLMICENNGLSTCSPLSVRQPDGRKIHEMVRAVGVPATGAGFGNDVLEVSRMVRDVVGDVRRGKGPAFLELETYRWREHCGPNYDFDLGYRTMEEFKPWRERCPLEVLQRHMENAGTWDAGRIAAVKKTIDTTIENAFATVRASAFPDKELLLQHVYAPAAPAAAALKVA